MIDYILALHIAITAYICSNVLTQPEHILCGVYNRLYKFFKTDERAEIGKGKHWLFMVLIHCEKCIAGQWSNIIYLILYWRNYDFLQHIFFMSFTILMAVVIKFLLNKHDDTN